MKSIWNTLKELFRVLPAGAKPFYIKYSILTSLLAVLDVAALTLILLVVTPVVSDSPIVLPLIGEVGDSGLVWLIIVICALFLLKSALAITLHWFATRKFAKFELAVGDELFDAFIRSNWQKRSSVSTAEITRIVDSSMANSNLGFILPLSQIPGNVLTFLAALVVLVVAQPLTALVALVYLSIFSAFMFFVISRRVKKAGQNNRNYAYKVATIMTEMVEAIKEVTLRAKFSEVANVVTKNRMVATRARANISFLGIVPKYAFEAALVAGFLVVGGAAFLIGGFSEAIISVALFAATGFRMIPAMTTVQSSFTTAGANEVYAKDVIRELNEARSGKYIENIAADTAKLAEKPSVLSLDGVHFNYDGSAERVIKGITLDVPFGTRLAIVGPSGSGKSTLLDILLGLSKPTVGNLEIDGTPLEQVLNQWRSRVGYVPQRVSLFDASIAQNVALTWEESYDPERVKSVLQKAQLADFLSREKGIEGPVGERGAAISGGQQQRLGIARALYSDPLVMVLDEATSALDTNTEKLITDAMRELAGEVTFITVAHRLATIKDYEQICYLDDGKILGKGTFTELVEQVPQFAHQANLAGLI